MCVRGSSTESRLRCERGDSERDPEESSPFIDHGQLPRPGDRGGRLRRSGSCETELAAKSAPPSLGADVVEGRDDDCDAELREPEVEDDEAEDEEDRGGEVVAVHHVKHDWRPAVGRRDDEDLKRRAEDVVKRLAGNEILVGDGADLLRRTGEALDAADCAAEGVGQRHCAEDAAARRVVPGAARPAEVGQIRHVRRID